MKRFIAAVIVCIFSLEFLVSAVFATEKYSLKMRFPEGKYTLQVESKVSVKMLHGEAEHQNVNGSKQIETIKVNAGSVDAEGNQKVIMNLSRIQLEADSVLGKMKYDSDRPSDIPSEIPGDMGIPFKMMGKTVGLELEILFDKDGNISKIEGLEKFIEKQSKDISEQEKIMLKEILDESAFVKSVAFDKEVLPKKSVSVGESWENTDNLELPVLGNTAIQITNTLKSVEKENDMDTATIHSHMQTNLEDLQEMDTGMIKMMLSDVEIKSDTTTKVEVETGLVTFITSKMEQKMKMDLGEGSSVVMQNIFESKTTVTRDKDE
ncbi:MAG: DUF6263 family protein [Planctomycetia bacterium]|nr:DUF6263 family protein [Planctomycetia bacterium]